MTANVPIVDASGNVRTIAADDFGAGSELLFQRLQLTTNGADVAIANGLPISLAGPAPLTGALTALNQAVVVPTAGMGSVAFAVLAGTYNMTFAFEACFDAGPTNWFPLLVSRLDTNSSYTSVAVSNSAFAWSAAVDGGMTYVRLRASAYTSGTANVIVAPNATCLDPTPTVGIGAGNVGINGSNNRIGFIAGSGIWQDATSTALGASATYTGASRDMANVASNTTFNSSSTYASEHRIGAEADQAGTLYLEVSRDNATWRRIKGQAATQFDASSVFYAEIIHKPSTRYARSVYVNGGVAQTQFMLQEYLMAAV